MSVKVSVYIATSLDGFIARPDGSLDWLPGAESDEVGAGEGEDYGWGAFWDSVDCLVLGRKTFEKVLEFGVWPYDGKRVIVLSRMLKKAPSQVEDKIEIYAGDPKALLERLASEGYERLYVDGGQTIQTFLRRGLISDLTITTIPILIGEGVPLFGALSRDIPLEHIRTEAFASGFVQSTYEVR